MQKKEHTEKKEAMKIKVPLPENSESKNSNILLLLFAAIGIGLLLWVTFGSKIGKENQIIVTVNGVEITEEEVNTELAKLPPYYLAAGVDQTALRTAIIDQLIAKTLLLEEAENKGIEVYDQEIADVILNLTISSAITEEELLLRLEEENMTIDDLEELIEEQLLLNKLIEQEVLANVEVTEEEILAVYEEGKEEYVEVRAQHILVCYEGAIQCQQTRTKEEAYARAEEVIKKLKEGTSFEDLAIEYSDDPSVEFNKGDLGWFAQGDMVPAFEEAVFGMNEGEVSTQPIETEYGYHVIMVTDRKDTFEDFREQILETLTFEKQKAALEAYVVALKADANIVYTSA